MERMSSVIEVSIEGGIPMPDDREDIGWPHMKMEVGQSFFISQRSLQSVCNANYRYSKKTGMRFTARKVGNGVRVWRTL